MTRWLAVAGVLAVGFLTWSAMSLLAAPGVEQPIQFPHKTHLDLDIQCTTCHQRAEKDVVAGRPPTELCLTCHAGGDGTAEIKKIQAYEEGGEIPWRRVWRLPRHVFFPHRTHVVAATLQCQTCHGPMETLTAPPARPLKTLSMDDCIDCHEKTTASAEQVAGRAVAGVRSLATDCNSCHR